MPGFTVDGFTIGDPTNLIRSDSEFLRSHRFLLRIIDRDAWFAVNSISENCGVWAKRFKILSKPREKTKETATEIVYSMECGQLEIEFYAEIHLMKYLRKLQSSKKSVQIAISFVDSEGQIHYGVELSGVELIDDGVCFTAGDYTQTDILTFKTMFEYTHYEVK